MANDKQPTQFEQPGIVQREKTLEDFFDIRGGTLNLIGILQTANFIDGARGVRMQNEGLDASGGTIQGVTLGNSSIPVSSGGTGAITLTGIVKGNGTSALTAIVPLSGTKIYYVSDTSGGAVNRKLTFTDGVLIAEI